MVHHEKINGNVGYSFRSKSARTVWRAKVEELLQFIRANDLHDKVVFHGTSTKVIQQVKQSGLRPSSVGLALGVDRFALGSFWGDLLTAVSYAEDTAKERHPSDIPALLAISVASLKKVADLEADGATVDFPNPGLTLLDDPMVEGKWDRCFSQMDWKDSLTDLGAIVAVHDDFIDFNELIVVNSVDDLMLAFAPPPNEPSATSCL